MNKNFTYLTLLLIVITSFIACNQNDSPTTSTHETSITSKLPSYRKVATYHSAGLDNICTKLNSTIQTRSQTNNAEISTSEKFKLISQWTKKFAETIEIPSDIQTKTRTETAPSTPIELIPFEDIRSDLKEYMDYINKSVLPRNSKESIKHNVDNLVASLETDDYFKSLNKIEQQAFMMYIVTLEDSYLYWTNNTNKWEEPQTLTRSIPNTDLTELPDENNSEEEYTNRDNSNNPSTNGGSNELYIADAAGAFVGCIGGICTIGNGYAEIGAIAGGMTPAGPVGVVAGVIGGYALGGIQGALIEGAIDSSKYYLTHGNNNNNKSGDAPTHIDDSGLYIPNAYGKQNNEPVML